MRYNNNTGGGQQNKARVTHSPTKTKTPRERGFREGGDRMSEFTLVFLVWTLLVLCILRKPR